MGYMRHNTIIVTCFTEDYINKAHSKALEIFDDLLVSNVIHSVINGYISFFIAPDGSKEGWSESDEHDTRRNEFIEWLSNAEVYADWVEVQYGDNDKETKIVRDSDHVISQP
jgi:hypothetical protein